MAGNVENDLIHSICEGEGKIFKGVCRYYDRFRKECVLLREQSMDEFWDKDKGRCAYAVFIRAEDGCMRIFKEIYGGLPIGDSVDYDMQAVIEQLKKPRKLKNGYTLPVWYRYVHITLYQVIGKKLGVVPERKECGACKHLSRSTFYTCLKKQEIQTDIHDVCEKYRSKQRKSKKPGKPECATCEELSRKTYFCYQKMEPRNKGDGCCEEYKQDIPDSFVSLDKDQHPGDNEDTHQVDRLLHKIRQTLEIHQTLADREKTPEEIIIQKEQHERRSFAFTQQLLNERIDQEQPGTKKRKIYERQYEIWINLWHSIAEIPREDLIKTIAREHNVTEKAIRCDLDQIREFLRKKNVLDE